MKNILIAQSGGPTVAINSSLLGAFEAAKELGFEKVYGACFGLSGLLKGEIVNLNEVLSGSNRQLLMQTPSCFLGSCRKKLLPFDGTEKTQSTYLEIAQIFKTLNIEGFLYIGGNDSMDTVSKLSTYFKTINNKVKIIGVPKTIDNDLFATDHCPGFGSAAKFVATAFLELERDCTVYGNKPTVTIVEVMGRDAGWLTAASALARLNGATGPNLIYCSEQNFSVEEFLTSIEHELKFSSNKAVLVAVSEGLKIESKAAEAKTDQGWFDEFCHARNAGVAKLLEKAVCAKIGCKVRSIELSLLQRCGAHLASATDLNEAKKIGEQATNLVKEGLTGVMATINRKSDEPYSVDFGFVDVEQVANRVKKMPADMFNGPADVSKKAMAYLKPLIQGDPDIELENGLPKHLHLNKNYII